MPFVVHTQRSSPALHGFRGTYESAQTQRAVQDLDAQHALRMKRAEMGMLVLSGLAGVTSLVLFATGRDKLGYALGIGSGVMSTVTSMIRLAED